jgi:hypothetical protein
MDIPFKVELGLLENGIDSIKHGIEHYCDDVNPARKYKYAVLHLAQGVLLLLKERLRREHHSLVYTKVEEVSKLDAKTVDVTDLLNRLVKISGVDLTYDRKPIEQLASLRNTIEHYQISITHDEANQIIAPVISFLTRFCTTALNFRLDQAIGQEAWSQLQQIDAYTRIAIEGCVRRLKEQQAQTVVCKRCGDLTAALVTHDRGKWKINYSLATCQVCQDQVLFRTNCRECSQRIENSYQVQIGSRNELSPIYTNFSYCENCKRSLRAEFPNFVVPEIVAEVRRWFQQNERATAEQLIDLVGNAITGSYGSRHTHLSRIEKSGLIRFANNSDREATEIYRKDNPMLFAPDYAYFVWSN